LWRDKYADMSRAGMGPDSRVLITKARKIAQKYMLTYGEPIPANQLVREIASVMQVFLLLPLC
jgi:20S proteasome subunit alpha 2